MRGYILLPHVVPIIAVLAATAAFAVVADGAWPGGFDLACLLGAMLGGQLAVGAVNELVDADLDAGSRPTKPIPAGLVTRRGAQTVVIGGLLLMCACSLRFSLAAFVLCVLGNGTGIAYSLWFKRTVWSWLPYVIAIPLIPIWVWTALASFPASLLTIYPVGIPAVIALQIAQSLPDVGSDRQAGVRTLAVVLGEEYARQAGQALIGMSIVVASVMAPWVSDVPGRVWVSAAVAGLLVTGQAALWRWDPRRGVMSMFPVFAAAAVILGVGWSVAVFGS